MLPRRQDMSRKIKREKGKKNGFTKKHGYSEDGNSNVDKAAATHPGKQPVSWDQGVRVKFGYNALAMIS